MKVFLSPALSTSLFLSSDLSPTFPLATGIPALPSSLSLFYPPSLSPALFPLLSPCISSRWKLLPSREEAGGGKSSSLPLSPLLSSSRLISLPCSLSRREFPPSLPLSLSCPPSLHLSCSPSLPPALSLSLPLSRPPSLSLSLALPLSISLSPPQNTLSLDLSFYDVAATWISPGSPGFQLDLEGVNNYGCARFG